MYEDLSLKINDGLNYHLDKTLYILRKDGHYDLLYKDDGDIGIDLE